MIIINVTKQYTGMFGHLHFHGNMPNFQVIQDIGCVYIPTSALVHFLSLYVSPLHISWFLILFSYQHVK